MVLKNDIRNKSKNIITTIICNLIIVCCGVFLNPVAAKADDVQKKDSAKSSYEYQITLKERGGITEVINGSDIKATYDQSQKKVTSYDENLLNKYIDNLKCFDESKIIESKDAKLDYVDGSYVIRKEIYGNRIDKNILYPSLVQAIKEGKTTLDLESINCYKDPTYYSDSAAVINAKDLANKYVSSKITYNYGGNTKTLDGSTINEWLFIGGDFNVTVLDSPVRSFVNSLASEYTASLGHATYVSGGYSGDNRGWAVDVESETSALIENIKNGDNLTKQPAYVQTSAASYLSNVGDTFVEVDMGSQYLWFYKDGYVVAEGDIVTGNLSEADCPTPAGCYSLNNKQKDAVLVGPNYQSPVCYWMPFIGNSIGLHDASWRSTFGGDIYKTNGSHGCVNLPYSLAQTIFDNISVGTPVICYY